MPSGTIIPPSENLFDPPYVCLRINACWLPAISAMVHPAVYPEFWAGTLEQNRYGRQQARALVNYLLEAEECNVSDCCHDQFAPIYTTDADHADLLVSWDNGVTSGIDPTDARLLGFQPPPPVGTVKDTKCDAASGVVNGLKDMQAHFATLCSEATSLTGFVTGVLTLLATLLGGPIGAALAGFLSLIIVGIWNIGCAAYNDLFTDERWDTVLCIIYCRMDEGGHISAQGWHDIIQDIRAQLPGYPAVFSPAANYSSLVVSAGWVLMNTWAYTYAADPDADCSACDCGCDIHDFVPPDATFGTIIEVGADYIIAESVHQTSPFDFERLLLTHNCTNKVTAIDVLFGGSPTHSCWTDSPYPGGTQSFFCPLPQDAYSLYWEADHTSTTFRVKITFEL